MPWRWPFVRQAAAWTADTLAAGAVPEPQDTTQPSQQADPQPYPRQSPPPANSWQFFVRAWRPVCGWIIALVLLRVLVVPMVQLVRGEPVEPIDLTAFAALAGALFISRTYERTHGGYV
jgi:hypothetical protein